MLKLSTKTLALILIPFLIISAGLVVYFVVVYPVGHAKIEINSDRELRSRFPGEGTLEDPIIIENLNIKTSYYYGLWIRDVSLCFEIRNCEIRASDIATYVERVTSPYCKITNTEFGALQVGLKVENSQSVIIDNNSINVLYTCIDVSNVSSVQLSNNNLRSLSISSVNEGDINNNQFTDGGMRIYYSSLNISNNYFVLSTIEIDRLKWEYNNYQARLNISHNVFVSPDESNIVTEGITFDYYVELDDFSESIFENNTIDGKDIIFLTHTSDRSIANMEIAKLILVKCNNITIETVNCTNPNPDNYYGIHKILQSSSININNSCFKNYMKFTLDSCQNVNITYNYFENSNTELLHLRSTEDSIIHHNSFMDPCTLKDDSGSNNFWYDVSTSSGNYYICFDGLPGGYTISGSTGSIDLYPLLTPPI